MHYLVTGGAGFIGSHIVDKLLNIGHHVSVVDDFSWGHKENIAHHKDNKKFSLYKKSICGDLTPIFKNKKIDGVFHLASITGVQYSIQWPEKTHKVNMNGTFNLLLACKKYRVKRLVFSSSSSVYGSQKKLPFNETIVPTPLSPYALHKLAGEHYCRLFHVLYNLETVNLRYFNIYGPRQDPHEKGYAGVIPKFSWLISRNKQPTINGSGRQTRDFTYVTDVVLANIQAMTAKNKNILGQSFNIGTGHNVSVNHLAKLILKISGKKIQFLHGPAHFEPRDSRADITKAKKLLKWEPLVTLEQGLKKTYKHFC